MRPPMKAQASGFIAIHTAYYRVRAYNVGGTSPNSNVIKAKTKPH